MCDCAVCVKRPGLLQFETLAAVLQLAGVRAENRDLRRHRVLQAKGRWIARHDQEQRVRAEHDALREIEAKAVEPPRVRRRGWIEQRDRFAREVPQFDELIVADVGMVMDFVDHHRADLRPGVRATQ